MIGASSIMIRSASYSLVRRAFRSRIGLVAAIAASNAGLHQRARLLGLSHANIGRNSASASGKLPIQPNRAVW